MKKPSIKSITIPPQSPQQTYKNSSANQYAEKSETFSFYLIFNPISKIPTRSLLLF